MTRQRNPVPFRGRKTKLPGKTHAAGAADAGGCGESCTDGSLSTAWMGCVSQKCSPPRQWQQEYAMSEYEKIYRFEHLYAAYRLAARGKRHKAEVIRFELKLSENLWKLHDELEERAYRPAPYYHFTIYDPKTREIQALRFPDRVVQRSLCDNVLRPWFENHLVYDCAACRTGKGTHFAMRRLNGFLSAFYREHGTKGYVLKCDIRKYFDSVDHEVLKGKLRKFPDREVRQYLYQIVDSYNADTGKGLPMGNQTTLVPVGVKAIAEDEYIMNLSQGLSIIWREDIVFFPFERSFYNT